MWFSIACPVLLLPAPLPSCFLFAFGNVFFKLHKASKSGSHVFVLFDFYDGAHSSAFLMNEKSSAVNPSSTWSMAWTLITYKGRAVTVRPSGVLELPAGFRLLPKGSGTSVPSVFFSVWVRMSLSQVPYLCWKVNTSLEMHKITWANHLKYS